MGGSEAEESESGRDFKLSSIFGVRVRRGEFRFDIALLGFERSSSPTVPISTGYSVMVLASWYSLEPLILNPYLTWVHESGQGKVLRKVLRVLGTCGRQACGTVGDCSSERILMFQMKASGILTSKSSPSPFILLDPYVTLTSMASSPQGT